MLPSMQSYKVHLEAVSKQLGDLHSGQSIFAKKEAREEYCAFMIMSLASRLESLDFSILVSKLSRLIPNSSIFLALEEYNISPFAFENGLFLLRPW